MKRKTTSQQAHKTAVCTENFFLVKVTQKMSLVVPILTQIHWVTLTHLKRKTSQFNPEKLSHIDSNSPMTQLLSQVESKKLALFLVTQFSSQLTQKVSHYRIWVSLTQFCDGWQIDSKTESTESMLIFRVNLTQ